MSGNQPLVFERDTGGAGTHALIIASGGHPARPSLDLQLPLSTARELADWLIASFRNPSAELASVEMLASAPSDQATDYVRPGETIALSLERPYFSAVQQAVLRWRSRLDSHPDNIGLFYYLGYGEREPQPTLLLDDFLESEARNSGQAVDFGSIPAGLRGSAARRQLYILEQIAGDFESLPRTLRARPLLDARAASAPGPTRVVIYARTQARKHSMGSSTFSAALLSCLDRPDADGPVKAQGLARRVQTLLARIGSGDAIIDTESTGDFDFHFPSPTAPEGSAAEPAREPDAPAPAPPTEVADFPGHRSEASFAAPPKTPRKKARAKKSDAPPVETESPAAPPAEGVAEMAGELETDDAVVNFEDLSEEVQRAGLRAVDPDDPAAIEETPSHPRGSTGRALQRDAVEEAPNPPAEDLLTAIAGSEGQSGEYMEEQAVENPVEGAPETAAPLGAAPVSPATPSPTAAEPETPAGDEAEQVDTEFVADDAELDRDDLGRAVPAISLARRLHAIWRRSNVPGGAGTDDDADRAAFVVHLDAPWGGGKTTFANFLARVLNPYPAGTARPARFLAQRYGEADLGGVFLEDPTTDADRLEALARLPEDARRPWIVVPFNAWRVEHIAPPWWVFFQSIRTACFGAILSEGDRPWHPASGGRRRSSLLRRFGRWLDLWIREFAWRLANPKIRALLLTALVSLALLGLLVWSGGWGVTEGERGSKAGFILANPLGLVLTGIGSITGLWALAALFTESIVPGSDTLAERLSLGSGDPFERFRSHFRRTMRRLRRPVMVVVDDLDRCRPDFVVDLIRGIQTLLRSPRVVFVILGDRDWIERAYEAHHQTMSKVDVGPEQSFGARFVEKAIQMSLILPALSDDRRLGYVRRVLLGEQADVAETPPAPAPAAAPVITPAERAKAEVAAAAKVRELANRIASEPAMSPFAGAPIVEKLHVELQNVDLGDEAAPGLRETLRDFANPSRSEQLRQLVNETLATRVATDEQAETTIVHDLQHFAGFFPANPRQIKRIVNAITLYYSIALARQAPDSELGDDFRTQLAMWVIIMTEWPQTWRLLASFPALVDILTSEDPDQAMRMPGLALPGSVAATHKAIAAIRADSDLMALITGKGLDQPHEPLTGKQVEQLAELTPLHSRKRRLPEIDAIDGGPPAARRRWPPLRRL